MQDLIEQLTAGPRTLGDLLDRAMAHDPDRVLFTWQGEARTVGNVEQASRRLANGLLERGLERGARVVVMMENRPERVELWFALARAGLVEVPINTSYRGELLAYQVRDSGAVAAILDRPFLDRFDEVGLTSDLGLVVVAGVVRGDGTGDVAPLAEVPVDGDLDGGIDGRELAAILYTSGTTGPSKGVLISQEHLTSFGFVYVDINRITADDVVLNYLPFFHIAGKFLTTACLLTGARMVLQPTLRTTGFWDEVRRHGVTNFIAVGGVCNMLMAAAPVADDANNPVRSVYAVPAPKEVYREFEQRFGVKLVEAYGSTETNLVVHTSLDESRPGSCGRPHPLFEVRIVDKHDREVPIGQSGEIVVRPRLPGTVMDGYNSRADATVTAWRNLWFHTGDRARRDEDGYLWFLDRIKDSIRRRGENISSFEVERLVGEAPGVAECAAIGVPADLGEEEVMVVAVAREGEHLDEEAIFRVCAERMPHFMVPRYIEIVDELPRTPTSKVEKYRLREAGVSSRTWDAHAHGLVMTRRGLRPAAAS